MTHDVHHPSFRVARLNKGDHPLKSAGAIRCGVGGWVYEPWRKTFFPEGLAKTKELHHASRQLGTIEINGTFYRTQSPATFRKWADETPDGFVFSVKASRYCVNRKDLADGAESITRFLESGLTEMGPKLGPILWQLAGTKKFVPAEIEGFLGLLPKALGSAPLRHVIEPRHPSFVVPEFVAMARRHGVAIVLALSEDYPLIADPTADFCYLRLQTTSADEPSGYDRGTVATWRERCLALAEGGTAPGLPLLAEVPPGVARDCFVYMIAGAKERNPAAAMALAAALEG